MRTKLSRILVIDDEPDNLSILAELLEKQGYTVLFALDGTSGIQRAVSGRPDLILLDVKMPGMDGFETCHHLKTSDITRDIPVIFMTVMSDTVAKVNGFECGAVDYITKPIAFEEVLARINTHLTMQQLQHELKIKNRLLADREAHLSLLVEEQVREIAEKALKIEHMTIALVKALEDANALNDTDTGNHLKRIGAYSAFLAEQFGCAREFVQRLKLYAPLHDVGKVGLPDALLKKSGRYTEQEFRLMQQHVVIGAILLDSDGIDLIAKNIALYHHEHWDGTGYIHHLAGADIPIEARIVAVADAYDALVSRRIYKEAFAEEQAEQIILEESGKHFDPNLVDIFWDQKHAIRDIHRTITAQKGKEDHNEEESEPNKKIYHRTTANIPSAEEVGDNHWMLVTDFGGMYAPLLGE
jgi:putative two-component system response regulator